MAIRFQDRGLSLEAPKFDYTNTPSSQAQNAAGLINIANSFNKSQENNSDYGSIAANAAANRIAKDATWLQQAGGIIGAKYTAETNEKIHDMELAAMKSAAREQAGDQIGKSIGGLLGGGIGLLAGGPTGAALGSKLGSGLGGMFG